MNKGTVILFIILALVLWIAAIIMNRMLGPEPAFTWAERATGILFGASCVFAIGFSLREWRRARMELAESEEAFLRDAESGTLGAPRVLSETVVVEGGSKDLEPVSLGPATVSGDAR